MTWVHLGEAGVSAAMLAMLRLLSCSIAAHGEGDNVPLTGHLTVYRGAAGGVRGRPWLKTTA